MHPSSFASPDLIEAHFHIKDSFYNDLQRVVKFFICDND